MANGIPRSVLESIVSGHDADVPPRFRGVGYDLARGLLGAFDAQGQAAPAPAPSLPPVAPQMAPAPPPMQPAPMLGGMGQNQQLMNMLGMFSPMFSGMYGMRGYGPMGGQYPQQPTQFGRYGQAQAAPQTPMRPPGGGTFTGRFG